MHFKRQASSQATYTSDGEAIMDSEANFDHFVRDLLQFTTYAIDQYPRHELARVDKDKFLSAFSVVRNGERVGVSSWDMGPGWTGNDVRVGETYPEDPKGMPVANLVELHHSDEKTDYPYGNKKVHDHVQAWKAHNEAMTKTIALCVASDIREDNSVQPNANRRRSEWYCVHKFHPCAYHPNVLSRDQER